MSLLLQLTKIMKNLNLLSSDKLCTVLHVPEN